MFGLGMLTNLVIIWRLFFCSPEINSANPFAHIKVEQQELIIGEARFPVHEVRKVAIDRSDGKGLLQLPYNGGGQIQWVFDDRYSEELKAYIRRTMPNAEIID
ncbi:hypothetical protein [Pseudoalteromonas sp. T1lg48]|uniref:hypothetical protein n=1 Tax=Pseudoalteromonas sp. T1lg48 TaxID=2077100 RepID=UPI000CF6F252|nr:hypothetical protein [Pseudoalteromonas sp. T1lg48]